MTSLIKAVRMGLTGLPLSIHNVDSSPCVKFKMKNYLRFFFVALFAAMSFTLTACSDDDDDNTPPPSTFAGTAWKVMTSEENAGLVGATITFNSDGTFDFDNSLGWTYAEWTLDGDMLKLVVDERTADDLMTGKIEFSGQHATYKYHWEDAESEWVNNKTYAMTLQKK